ncbi:alpha/beta fold hydrolase [Uliginosibacterium paludis]|uniref:Alpha/beta fold hydrolase n=1 Tax=Uliginosibacterium paludis TaxID=1615952 RepID=A0ABV2CLZ7_9RHOO
MNPVVLLQGWGFSSRIWAGLQEALPDLQLQTPRVDESAGTLAARADALSAHLARGSIVVGWSLGAMLAIETARRHPERVSGLFLIGANAAFVRRESWPDGLAPEVVSAFRQDFTRQPARTLKRFLALQIMGDGQRAPLQALLDAALLAPHTPGLSQGLEILENASLMDALPAIRCPVELLHGKHDAIMPVAAARVIAQRIPHARLTEVADAGHCPLFTQPAQMAALIRAFADDR